MNVLSNVIQFLETLGRRPPMAGADYTAAVAGLGLNTEHANALLSRDASPLSKALDGRSMMLCAVAMPEDDEPRDVHEINEAQLAEA